LELPNNPDLVSIFGMELFISEDSCALNKGPELLLTNPLSALEGSIVCPNKPPVLDVLLKIIFANFIMIMYTFFIIVE